MSAEQLDEQGFLKTEGPVTDEGTGAPVAPNSEAEQPTTDTAPKKRRGRPPKNPQAPGTESIPSGSTAPRKSKPGKKSFSPADIQMMGKQITGLHMIVAQMTASPELVIREEEGQMLAQSVVNVCEQYDLAIDGKTGAFIQLIGVAGMVYAPRFFAFRARMAQSKQAAQNPAPGNVIG